MKTPRAITVIEEIVIESPTDLTASPKTIVAKKDNQVARKPPKKKTPAKPPKKKK